MSKLPIDRRGVYRPVGWIAGAAQGLQRLDNVDADKRYVRNRVSAHQFNVNVPGDWMVALWRGVLSAAQGGTRRTRTEQDPCSRASACGAQNGSPVFSLSRNVYNQFADEGFVPDGYDRTDLPLTSCPPITHWSDWKFTDVSVSWKSTLVGRKNLQLDEESHSSSKRRHSGSVEGKSRSRLPSV